MMKPNKPIGEEEAFRKLSALCARAEHSSGEMGQKLVSWGVDDDVRDRVMARLVAGKYVDDERYAKAFVEDKIVYNKWGRRKIEQALYQKRVPKDITDRVLGEVPESDYMEVLRPLIQEKWRTVTGRTDYERSMKVIQYALGKGFDMHLIRQCVDQADDWADD